MGSEEKRQDVPIVPVIWHYPDHFDYVYDKNGGAWVSVEPESASSYVSAVAMILHKNTQTPPLPAPGSMPLSRVGNQFVGTVRCHSDVDGESVLPINKTAKIVVWFTKQNGTVSSAVSEHIAVHVGP